MLQQVHHLSLMGQRAPGINLTHIIHIFGAQSTFIFNDYGKWYEGIVLTIQARWYTLSMQNH